MVPVRRPGGRLLLTRAGPPPDPGKRRLVAAGRGRPVSLRPVLVIGLAYTVYGIWVVIASGLDPFFLVFVVPGVLLLAAAVGRP